jgi:hypothetical protein
MNSQDLIKQYVNTGMQIPEYQLDKLNNNQIQSYFRTRLIGIEQSYHAIELYEYKKMNDKFRNEFVSKLDMDNRMVEYLTNLNYKAGSDDLVTRIIDVKPYEFIEDSLGYLINYSIAKARTIHTVLEKYPRQSATKGSFIKMLNSFDSDESQYKFIMTYMKKTMEHIDDKLTVANYPIEFIVRKSGRLPINLGASVIKYIIVHNLKKPEGDIIDDDTFFTMIDDIPDKMFVEIANFMKKYLKLTDNQNKYLDSELSYYNGQ